MAQREFPERMRALREPVPVCWPALRELQQDVVLAELESICDIGVLVRLVADLAEVRYTTRNFATHLCALFLHAPCVVRRCRNGTWGRGDMVPGSRVRVPPPP